MKVECNDAYKYTSVYLLSPENLKLLSQHDCLMSYPIIVQQKPEMRNISSARNWSSILYGTTTDPLLTNTHTGYLRPTPKPISTGKTRQ